MSNLSELIGGGGGGGTSIGAIGPDSFCTWFYSGYVVCASPADLDAGRSFTREGNYLGAQESILEGICYSSYHSCWFAQGGNLNNSTSRSDRCVYQSYDGIHWTSIFKITEKTGQFDIPSQPSTSNGYSFMAVDDSNGRLWLAGTKGSSPYSLRLWYYDFTGDFGDATEVLATGDPSGTEDSQVEYMQWLPNTQVILIFYRNTGTTGQLKRASISAGGTTVTYRQTFSPGSGQPYRYGFALDDTNNKYYIQNDSTTAFWYSGSSPHTGTWSSVTKSSGAATAFQESGQMAIGGNYIIFAGGNGVFYMDLASTWNSTTGWSYNSSAVQTGANAYGCYYDETNSRFAMIGTFGIYTSSTPNTGLWEYKAGSGMTTTSLSGDLKMIRAHS